MRSFGFVRFGFATAILAVLTLSLHCAVASSAKDPSSSISIGSAPPEQQPPAEPLSRAERFFDQLSSERIDTLLPVDSHDENRFHELPFYSGLPIFAPPFEASEVERALKDYNSVIILDPEEKTVLQALYAPGHPLGRKAAPLNEVLLHYRIHPDVHKLRHHYRYNIRDNYFSGSLPEEEEIDHLPHVDRIPILSDGSSTLGQLRSASYGGAFWYISPNHEPLLINPRREQFASVASAQAKEKIEKVVKGYEEARTKLHDQLAGLIWGAPIPLDSEHVYGRSQKLEPSNYPIVRSTATRDELVAALQRHARIWFHVEGDNRGPFKVKVVNRDAAPGTTMEFKIKPKSLLQKSIDAFRGWRLREP